MIAFTAIMLHFRFLPEHKVDAQVFQTIKKEQLIGVLLIIAGFILEMTSRII